MAKSAAERDKEFQEQLQAARDKAKSSRPLKRKKLGGEDHFTSTNTVAEDKNAPTVKITMPGSGRILSFQTVMAPISQVRFDQSINPRDRDLLFYDDPEVKEIVDDILQYGQREPALVRLSSDYDYRYDLIYGSRRLFALQWIAENVDLRTLSNHPNVIDGLVYIQIRKPYSLIGDAEQTVVHDAEAMALSEEENEKRANLTAWESAVQKMKKWLPVIEREGSVKKAAEALGVSRMLIQRQQTIAWIPKEVIKVLVAPSALKQRDEGIIRKLRAELDRLELDTDLVRQRAVEARQKGLRFNTLSDFRNKMLPELKTPKHNSADDKQISGANGGPSFDLKFDPNDPTKASIKVSGLSTKHQAELINLLSGLSIQEL